MDYNEAVRRIADYIRRGETERENFRIGMEVEHFLIREEDFRSVSYYGEHGVEETMRKLHENGFEEHGEATHVLSLLRGDAQFTTEPGGQLELSIAPQKTLEDLEKIYNDTMHEVMEIIRPHGQRVAAMGYHPVTKIDEIKLLPKARYDHMYRYFFTSGRYAHNMMKGTASLQASVDYVDEADWTKKLRLLSVLSPVFYAIFDNAPIFEGEVYPKHALRQSIWEETDRARTGLIPDAFDPDFGYEAYAKWLLEIPPIFMEKDGVLRDETRPFREVITEEMGDEEIFHMLSIVFPDIRAKTYLEVRMPDSMPQPYGMSATALIYGLMKNAAAVDTLSARYAEVRFADAQKAKESVEENGVHGLLMGEEILGVAQELRAAAAEALGEEAHYLEPLDEILTSGKTLKERFTEKLAHGLGEAMKMEVLR